MDPSPAKDNLDFKQLYSLLQSVFALNPKEGSLTIMVDLPDARLKDTPAWMDRRRIALEWHQALSEKIDELPFDAVLLCAYQNVGTNNNDLPGKLNVIHTTGAHTYAPAQEASLEQVLKSSSIVLAPTELSATAPLKNWAKGIGFRGATMPGFSRGMIPALMLNYEDVHARVADFAPRLNRATRSNIRFEANNRHFALEIDLRHRPAHASDGLMREPGTVANLPSGEAYIVPYEGEKAGDPSTTKGEIPVQFGDEVVVYRIECNKAVDVLTSGPASDNERSKLRNEPAYGNIAELGLGVLGEWGVRAMGSILVDEKLGLHIAFGRSEHFGGSTGPAAFRKPENVIHIDRVYVPSSQPAISVPEVSLTYEGGMSEVIMVNGKYIV